MICEGQEKEIDFEKPTISPFHLSDRAVCMFYIAVFFFNGPIAPGYGGTTSDSCILMTTRPYTLKFHVRAPLMVYFYILQQLLLVGCYFVAGFLVWIQVFSSLQPGSAGETKNM